MPPPSQDDSYMFNRQSNEWETLPDLPTGRYSGGCGVVRNDTGTYVVVVGGYYNDYSDVVEIYSVEEGVWKSGMRGVGFDVTGVCYCSGILE